MENDDIFTGIRHSINVLQGLQSADAFVLGREEINERFLEELGNFEVFMKRIKNIFLGKLMEDLNAISKAAVLNTGNSDKAVDLIGNMGRLIEEYIRMELNSIAESNELIRTANKLKANLSTTKKEVKSKVESRRKHDKALNSALTGVPQGN
ncbi:hypothetical protein HY487_01415 [Candidatus Woesearchaeota archaeon]|nr:hypothetical protein [Candidatus Woesearchaeota archaeon]